MTTFPVTVEQVHVALDEWARLKAQARMPRQGNGWLFTTPEPTETGRRGDLVACGALPGRAIGWDNLALVAPNAGPDGRIYFSTYTLRRITGEFSAVNLKPDRQPPPSDEDVAAVAEDYPKMWRRSHP